MSSPFESFDVYVLWLMLCKDDHQPFQDIVELFVNGPADQHWFNSHMTLEALPGHDESDAIVARIDSNGIFATSAALQVEFTGISMRHNVAQALYFPAVPTNPLMTLNERIRQMFGVGVEPYMPHASAAYGQFNHVEKRDMSGRILSEFPFRITFDRVALYHAKGFPNQWREVHSWKLEG